MHSICYRKCGGSVDLLYQEFSKMFKAGLLAQAADAEAKDEDNVVVKGKAKCKAVLLSDLNVEWFRGTADATAEFAGADGKNNTAATVAFVCANPDCEYCTAGAPHIDMRPDIVFASDVLWLRVSLQSSSLTPGMTTSKASGQVSNRLRNDSKKTTAVTPRENYSSMWLPA